MEQQTLRKTFKYKLKPAPEQERAMAFVMRRYRDSTTPPCKNAATRGRSAVCV